MEKSRTRGSSDSGYSLIELVVSILVSGIIVVAVVGFLTTGLNHYRRANAESTLQMESQLTEYFITELFQESTDYKTLDASTFGYPEVTYAVQIQRTSGTSILAKVGNELWFSAVDGGKTESEQMNELMAKGKAGAFLAGYVDTFFLQRTTFEDARNMNGLLGITIQFVVDGRSYMSLPQIKLRNMRKN